MSTETADDDVVDIRAEAYDKIDYWRDKIDQAPKLKKRAVFERAADDIFLEAQCEHDLGAVQAIADAVYYLGRDHAALSDDDIQFVMNGAEARAERFAERGRSNGNEQPPPSSSEAITVLPPAATKPAKQSAPRSMYTMLATIPSRHRRAAGF